MRAIFLLCLLATSALAYQPLFNWVPGVTVGVRGGIPTRTNIIDVTQAPYNVDNTGATETSAAITSAIAGVADGSVIYFPSGIYNITNVNGIIITRSSITLRGTGSNSVLVGNIRIGSSANGNTLAISSGSTKGSTSMTLASGTIYTNDMFIVSGLFPGSESWPVIDVFSYNRKLAQPIVVTGVSGTTITFAPPLAWDWTNTPMAQNCTLNGIAPSVGYVGLENLTITTTNGTLSCDPGFVVRMTVTHDCWITNCSILWADYYNLSLTVCAHNYIGHNSIRIAKGNGSNHSGLLVDSCSGCLVEDNIIADYLQPGIEFNDGVAGNAFFGNFFTNNYAYDIDCHNDHPVLNLFEANVLTAGFEMDGYFGSASHETLFRNNFASPYVPLAFKRWTTYMQVVGNVLGTYPSSHPSSNYLGYADNSSSSGWLMLELGRPNIGNGGWTGVNPPIPWNYPGDTIDGIKPNGIYTFTNTQANTTNLIGNFTNIIVSDFGDIIFQDPAITNFYWPADGIPTLALADGTVSNLYINRSITVSNGWKVYSSRQGTYQQLQTLNAATHTIAGNYDYYNHGIVWTNQFTGTNPAQSFQASLLYTNGAPSWWGSVRWPAMDPTNSTLTAAIPAELRYLGTTNSPAPQVNIPENSTPFIGGGAIISVTKQQ